MADMEKYMIKIQGRLQAVGKAKAGYILHSGRRPESRSTYLPQEQLSGTGGAAHRKPGRTGLSAHTNRQAESERCHRTVWPCSADRT